VTPLVDVVLVLLIIFMVITPLLTKTFWIHTPKQETEQVPQDQLQNDPNPPLVLHVGADRAIEVNGTSVTFEELAERLRRMFAARDDHILFFDATDDAEYGFAVQVMDQARAGGAITIAPLTQGLSDNSATAATAPAPTPAN
jgi:biopolymer transport protein ExbD/biopolymer transport protein TolR